MAGSDQLFEQYTDSARIYKYLFSPAMVANLLDPDQVDQMSFARYEEPGPEVVAEDFDLYLPNTVDRAMTVAAMAVAEGFGIEHDTAIIEAFDDDKTHLYPENPLSSRFNSPITVVGLSTNLLYVPTRDGKRMPKMPKFIRPGAGLMLDPDAGGRIIAPPSPLKHKTPRIMFLFDSETVLTSDETDDETAAVTFRTTWEATHATLS